VEVSRYVSIVVLVKSRKQPLGVNDRWRYRYILLL